jgi:hypothetical protein
MLDGVAIGSRERISTLNDESILSIGVCQIRAGITSCLRCEQKFAISSITDSMEKWRAIEDSDLGPLE